MQEKLITFDTAKSAKEKGFKEATIYAYNEDGSVYSRDLIPHNFNSRGLLSAPTQNQLCQWLSDTYNIVIKIVESKSEEYYFQIWGVNGQRFGIPKMMPSHNVILKTHKGKYSQKSQALEEALKESLTFIS